MHKLFIFIIKKYTVQTCIEGGWNVTVANRELCACIDERCGSNSKISVILWIGLLDIGFSVIETSQATYIVK